eukprot:scaffold31792_cov168-Amphora_coffeaeformis.AAC.12
MGSDAEIMTGLLVAGLAVAAYQEYRTDKFEAVKEFTKTHREQIEQGYEELQAQVETLTEKAATATEEATTAAMETAAKIEEEVKVEEPVTVVTIPSPALVATEAAPAPKEEPKLVSEPKPAVVALERSKPSPSEKTDRSTSDDLTELVKKVGKTVEQNKEMEDLVKARREKEAAAEDATEQETVIAVVTEGKPKKRSIIRKAWRVTKKVVAPWRKWENIS